MAKNNALKRNENKKTRNKPNKAMKIGRWYTDNKNKIQTKYGPFPRKFGLYVNMFYKVIAK